MVELRLAVESIAGRRPYQEDAAFARRLPDGRVLLAVADGMGGHAAGDVASALALEALVGALEAGEPLDTAFVRANQEVHARAQDPDKHGMGTTLVAALIEDGEYFVANVGDSRGYLVTGSGVRQITRDHSFVAEAVMRGKSEAEVMRSPFRDALTRSVGTDARVEVDFFGPFPVQRDTALLICSDGLHKTLGDEQIGRIVRDSGDPGSAAEALVHAAFDGGSDDNISVVIGEYGEVRGSGIDAPSLLDTDADTPDVDTPDVDARLADRPVADTSLASPGAASPWLVPSLVAAAVVAGALLVLLAT